MARLPNLNLLRRRRPARNARPPREAPGKPPMAYIRTADGRMLPLKTSPASYSSPWIDYLQRAPGELRADDTGLLLAYFASVFAFRCLRVRARKVASLPHYLTLRETGKPVEDDPIERAIVWAYRKHQQDLLYQWAHSRSMWGETYIEPVKDWFGRTAGLRWLNPLAIEPFESAGEIQWFDYYGGDGRTYQFAPEALIFEREFNPANDLRGVGLLQQALDAINVDRNVQAYIRSYFGNGAVAGLIFTPKTGQLSDQDQKKINDALSVDLQGVENWFNPLVMPTAFDVTVVEPPELDDQVILREDTRREICAAIGVPIGLVIHDEAKYQLSPEQRATFYEEEIIPEAEGLGRAGTALMLPHFGLSPDAYEWRIDTSDLKTSVADDKAKTELAASRFSSGLATFHEARETVGLPKPDGEDFLLMPVGMIAVPVSQVGQAAALINEARQPAPSSTPLLAAPEATQAVDAPQSDATPAGDPLWIGLYFANNPDLIALQNRVKALFPGEGQRWTDPADFHITLAYAPAADEAHVEAARSALAQLDPPQLAVGLASLRVFDNVGEFAVHFRVRRNADLLDFQEQVYDILEATGIAMSSHSAPGQFIPHITMGYLSSKPGMVTYNGRVTVRPTSCALSRGDDIILTLGEEDDDERAAKALDELSKWQAFAKNNGAQKAASRFVCHYVPPWLEAWVREEVGSMDAPEKADLRTVFDAARFALDIKTYYGAGGTREQFYEDILNVIRAAQANETARRQFSGRMRSLLRRYGLIAYRDGMNEVGYDPESFSKEELAEFRAWQADQSTFVSNFGAEIFKEGGIAEAEVELRAGMWADMSLEDIRQRGIAIARPEQHMEWVEGDTIDKCEDCLRLNGQVHTMKQWIESGYTPTSRKTKCRSYGCKCRLKPTDKPIGGNF